MTNIGYGAVVGAIVLSISPFGASRQTAPSKLFVAPTGRDNANCSHETPCTFDHAYHIAKPGATVMVAAGTYPQTDASARTTRITPDRAKAGPKRVTFVCAGNGHAVFAAPAFTIQASYLTIRGSCFRFHRIYVSQRGSTVLDADHVTLDGVHMDTIEIAGADAVTIKNSEIGPMDDCYAPGRTGIGLSGTEITPGMWCDPKNPVENYWATVSDGTETNQGQPFVHPNLGRDATNITFANNVIDGIQTKDPSNIHSGGFLLQGRAGNCDHITFLRNRWTTNFGFDMLFDSAPNCVTLSENLFGPSYEAMPNNAKEITGRPVVLVKTGVQTALANWTVRGNSLAFGLALDPAITYSGIRIQSNVLGMGDCGTTQLRGVEFNANVVLQGCGGANAVPLPYGYRFDSGSLLPESATSSVVKKIFAAAAQGSTTRAILKELRKQRATPPSRRRWAAATIASIVSDPVYLGNRYGPPGIQPALVAGATWRRAQTIVPKTRRP